MNKVKEFLFQAKCERFFLIPTSFFSATGTLLRLTGNNPVQPEGKTAIPYTDNVVPPLIAPVYAYTGTSPSSTGQIVAGQATGNVVAIVSAVPTISGTPALPKPSSGNGHNPVAAIPSTVATPTIPTPILPTASLPPSSTLHLPTVLPSAAKSISSSSSDSDSPAGCGTAPKRRQPGLDYHRHHHRRLSHVPRHDHDFYHDNY
jgi:hypothetical protein